MYKKYRNKVGGMEIKNLKKMWEVIATDINKSHNFNVSAAHCENRWRVVERSYKKFIDNNKQTGRGRKVFEYETVLNEIFTQKCY